MISYKRDVLERQSLSEVKMGNLHVLEGTMNAQRYIKVLEQHMLPSRRCLFQGRPCVFQQEIKTHILQLSQQHGFIVDKFRY